MIESHIDKIAILLLAAGLVAMLFAASPRRIPLPYQHILVWGDCALALGLPASVPYQSEIITVTFGVVAFSIIVQGLTITPLLRRLGLLDAKQQGSTEKLNQP